MEEAVRQRRLRDAVDAFQSRRAVRVAQKYARRWIETRRAANG